MVSNSVNRDIAASFDKRASRYSRSAWHRSYAEKFVSAMPLYAGDNVLDAATGTGFAAIAAARTVGPSGRVTGVDISAGMLDQARHAIDSLDLLNVSLEQADVVDLSHWGKHSFDSVLCSAGLLYLPVPQALVEWHRVLKPGGIIGFSTMRAGFPITARLFRECATQFGLSLRDPNSLLGTIDLCKAALSQAGFISSKIFDDYVEFSDEDLSQSWELHIRSPLYADIGTLSGGQISDLEKRYRAAITQVSEESLRRAEVLFALAYKPAH